MTAAVAGDAAEERTERFKLTDGGVLELEFPLSWTVEVGTGAVSSLVFESTEGPDLELTLIEVPEREQADLQDAASFMREVLIGLHSETTNPWSRIEGPSGAGLLFRFTDPAGSDFPELMAGAMEVGDLLFTVSLFFQTGDEEAPRQAVETLRRARQARVSAR